jgi:hypothetical protein
MQPERPMQQRRPHNHLSQHATPQAHQHIPPQPYHPCNCRRPHHDAAPANTHAHAYSIDPTQQHKHIHIQTQPHNAYHATTRYTATAQARSWLGPNPLYPPPPPTMHTAPTLELMCVCMCVRVQVQCWLDQYNLCYWTEKTISSNRTRPVDHHSAVCVCVVTSSSV